MADEEMKKAVPKMMLNESVPSVLPEKKYRITFLCANNEVVVFDNVGAINDLSISLACVGMAISIQPKIASFRIIDIEEGRVVSDCGILGFIAATAPAIAKAMNLPIIHTMQLKRGQKIEDFVETIAKKQREKK